MKVVVTQLCVHATELFRWLIVSYMNFISINYLQETVIENSKLTFSFTCNILKVEMHFRKRIYIYMLGLAFFLNLRNLATLLKLWVISTLIINYYHGISSVGALEKFIS